jgi:hypothetical protein
MTRMLAVAALVATSASAYADDKPNNGVPIVGVGVVSVDQKMVFLPAKGGGVEAVDLASGKVLWLNKEASKLAGASDKLVFALVADEKKPHTFRVVAFDIATGKTLGKSDVIAMSDWATTAKVGGRSFRVAAKAEGEGAVVAWQARAFYYGGAAPTPQILEAAKKEESALVTVDFKTGKLTRTTAKPKDADFDAGTGGKFNNKLGDYEFQVEEQIPGFQPGASTVTKVTFKVLKGGKELWTRELAGNPWSPPPP